MAKEETTFDKIARLSYTTTTKCNCQKCKDMCRTPCLGTPEDIMKLVNAGYSDKLSLTIWAVGMVAGLTNKPIYMIQPKVVDGWCVFYHNGLCELHDRGLKPTEGKLAFHSITNPLQADIRNNPAWLVAKEWTKDENFYSILEIYNKIK